MVKTLPSHDRAAWEALAAKALSDDETPLRKLVSGGTIVEPLYERVKTDGPRPWRGTADWMVAQRVDDPDAERANRSVLLDLDGGADALTLVFPSSPFARGLGLPPTANALDAALRGVELDFIAMRLDAGTDAREATSLLVDLVRERRLTSAGLAIDLGYDPIGLSACGHACLADDLTAILDASEAAGLSGRPLLADGRAYHEAGAGEALELAAVLATGVALLRLLEAKGLSLDEARGKLAFQLAVDADLFPGLAKIRAMRRLWTRIEEACGLTHQPIRLHAETAWRMMTRRDPWVNVMRTTSATVAAGLGGADIVTVLPFTLALGLPDDDARRLARNGQRVLLDEAHLGKVDDPAAGAGSFEALTDQLCNDAWARFQTIERDGGIEKVLRKGTLQAEIAAMAHLRAGRFATLQDGIVGTSRFPSLVSPEIGVRGTPKCRSTALADALPSQRDAEPFEALRDRADALPSRPQAFLATLGAPAAFGARATYAANVLAAAGIETRAVTTTRHAARLLSDFQTSGLRIACLCGTNEAYAADAGPLAAALRDAGARLILVAGEAGTAFHDASIDAILHDGADILGILAASLEATSKA